MVPVILQPAQTLPRPGPNPPIFLPQLLVHHIILGRDSELAESPQPSPVEVQHPDTDDADGRQAAQQAG